VPTAAGYALLLSVDDPDGFAVPCVGRPGRARKRVPPNIATSASLAFHPDALGVGAVSASALAAGREV
jgi:hypothetical protein